jgi:hypothetical protein
LFQINNKLHREGKMNVRNIRSRAWLLVVMFFVSLSCNMPFIAASNDLAKTPPTPINATDVAQTVIAGLTKPALTLTNTVPPPPGITSTNTLTPLPEPATITPTPTLTQRPCNQAVFMADVTIPDGSEIQTNNNFTKTWRLQNAGSCPWTSGYHVVYVSGDRMNAPDAVAVTGGSIPYGGSVDVSVPLKAPGSAGTYRGDFRLRSPDGVVFGVGGGASFYVQIVAVAPIVEEPPVLPPPVVAQPDLKISDITFIPYPPRKNHAVTVKVSTYNQGNAPSGPYQVKWWPGEYYGSPACTWNVDNSNASGGRVLSCVYAGYPSVYASINTKASVDTGGAVAESNEGNNTRLKSIEVTN